MKTLRQSVSICLTLTAIALFSCKKNHDSPAPEKPADSTVFHINYIYLATAFQIQQDSVKEFELILSAGNGSVLLDTIAPVNTSIIADIKTIQKNLDLTVIRYRPVSKAWYMVTEKAINPSDWSILPGSDSLFGLPPNIIPDYTAASIHYSNIPLSTNEPYLWGESNANIQRGLYPGLNSGSHDLTIGFYKEPDEYVYLAFPNKALYNLHHMTQQDDEVDLSKMDTAVRVRFTRPAQLPLLSAYLNGFVDPTNQAKNIFLSQNIAGTDTIVGADLVYPGKKIFSKYSCILLFNSTDGKTNSSYFDHWCDSVNPNPVLVDDSYSYVSASANNNFSVRFNKTQPGYYSTGWGSSKFYLTLDAPSDSTTLHPLDFLTALKSKMLKGQDLNAMKLMDFTFGYQVDKTNLVPVKLAPADNKYHPLSEQPVQVFYTKQF